MANRWTKDETSELRGLVLKGHTNQEISDIMDITKNMVAGKCHRLDLKVRNERKRQIFDNDVCVLDKIKSHTDSYGWGLELSEIIEFTGYSFFMVAESLKRMKASGRITETVSYVADHVFYNDARRVQL